MASDELPLAVMSKTLQRTENAVQTKAKELGLIVKKPSVKRSDWSGDHIELLKQMSQENLPVLVVCKKLGRAKRAVEMKAKELGLSLKPPGKKRFSS
ncbi:MAG: hypothetical protein ACR652_07515 [Methylocystis sp.]|uniref:hypothetical protein n=1 Tax=Methylocystis sp. TaxID=1911079 RepID=UPI003DA59774